MVVGVYLSALQKVSRVCGVLEVLAVWNVDGLADGDAVALLCLWNWSSDNDWRRSISPFISHLWDVVGGKTSELGVCPVHHGGEACTAEVEIANYDSWDLRWERWTEEELRLVGAETEEAEWHDLVCASVAGQEWEGWVLASVGDNVVVVLLGELEPWCTQVGEDTVECVRVCGTAGWRDGVGDNGVDGVSHRWPIWRLAIGVVVEVELSVGDVVAVLVVIQGV